MSCGKDKKISCGCCSDKSNKKFDNGKACCACGEVGCKCGAGVCDFKEITAEELKSKMQKDPKLMVVNVLDKNAFDNCHIKGSINAPLKELQVRTVSWDKNKEIILYCAHKDCPASKDAYKVLSKLGFKNLVLFEGGMKEWAEKKFPSEGACKLDNKGNGHINGHNHNHDDDYDDDYDDHDDHANGKESFKK